MAVSICSLAISCGGQRQGATPPEPSQTNAPTGTYATGAPVRLTLHLGTNGTYEVQAQHFDGQQQGTWKWDSKQREFRFKPTPGKFPFDLRRLRVDPDDPHCLQWIPVTTVGGGAGAIDYVRFIRQKD